PAVRCRPRCSSRPAPPPLLVFGPAVATAAVPRSLPLPHADFPPTAVARRMAQQPGYFLTTSVTFCACHPPAHRSACFVPIGGGHRVELKRWPRAERPREKLLQLGARSLSDGELLAVLLGSGFRGTDAVQLAWQLLERAGGLDALLAGGAGTLSGIKGLGPARLARLRAAVELGRRHLAGPTEVRSALKAPQDAARVF